MRVLASPNSGMSEKKSVAFLGPEASYTHQAALAAFAPASHEFVPLTTIPSIFAAVQSGATDYGVVPFYNTTYGAVIATLDSLATALLPSPSASTTQKAVPSRPTPPHPPVPETGAPSPALNTATTTYPNVRVHSEATLPIRHCLLGHAPQTPSPHGPNDSATTPPPRWPHITRVYSHEQALGQCTAYLSTHLPNAERITDTSTSRAAARLANTADPTIAAISSDMAAALYDVPVLESDIQDADDNTTRFFVLAKDGDGDGTPGGGGGAANTALVAFTVPHSAPGALARCLALLERYRLNAVGIQQRPPNRARAEDAIFVEVQGEGGIESVWAAVEALEAGGSTGACLCLGVWES